MRKSWKRLISVVLSAAMILALAVTGFAAPSSGSSKGVTWEKLPDDAAPSLLTPRKAVELDGGTPEYADKDVVRVSIVLNGQSTLEKMDYAAKNIAENASAMSYRAGLKSEQDAVAAEISSKVLGGAKLDVVWNLTLAANIISANVEYGKIDAIKALPDVKDVFVEMRYEPDVATVEANDPNMSVASEMTGATYAWAAGYTGAGSKVAVVDTGLDTDHQSFDGGAFDYAIASLDKDVDLLEASEVAAVWDELNAAKFIDSAEASYLTSKVPYAVNYVDHDLDVTHDNDRQGEHGSHVAGIAVGNRYVDTNGDGTYEEALTSVLTQGEAPDAQLLVMKVFGKGGGAYDSDYMAAIEDAIVLGADSVNLSLGSSVAGFAYNNTYNYVFEKLEKSGLVWANSAGNNSNWGANLYGPIAYLYGEDKNFATGGSPATYSSTLSVASVDNKGYTGEYFTVDGSMIFYTENLGYGNEPISSIVGDYSYVLLDGPGVADNNGTDDMFAALGSDIVSGKIAVCNRGGSSFFAKANAAIAQGAVAVIIANNTSGIINMNLSGYEYTAPAVSITQADGAAMKAAAEEKTTEDGVTYYEGAITVESGVATNNPGEVDYYTMSSFSSWGVPGNLTMKPEITAPGGNIYSVNGYHLDTNGAPAGGHDMYENMSGTSMASPQIAGVVAVFAEYIRDNDLLAKTGLTQRQLVQSLLMSTAEPLIEEGSGYYYSILNQGAGLVDVNAAMNAKSYILMDDSASASAADGKVKVELGDDPDRAGTYSAAFTINNFSDEDVRYELSAEFFTQDYFRYYEFDEKGNPVGYSYYQDTWTAPLDATLSWTVDGEAYDPETAGDAVHYDFNGDGIISDADVQALLDYIVGNLDEIANEDYADIDGDGDVDTYDAYLVKEALNTAIATAPAGESIEVELTFTLNDIDDYDLNGAYIEGYIYADEMDSWDGAIGVSHSIPVLGFYGGWTESTMFDHSTYLDYVYGTADHVPYMLFSDLGTKAYSVTSFLVRYAGESDDYMFGGNPFMEDEEYLPERNALSSDDTLNAARYSQIRNAGAALVTVTDDAGKELFSQETDGSYAAYYYPNQGTWQSMFASKAIGYSASDVAEGTVLTATVALAPEYYVTEEGVDWDALGDGAKYSISYTIDDTDPEIEDVKITDNEVEKEVETENEAGETVTETVTVIERTVEVTVSDNQYIAAVAIENAAGELYDVFGSDAKAAAGDSYTVSTTFEVSSVVDAYLLVEVYDYAANGSVYKVNFNAEEEFVDEEAFELAADKELVIVGGGSAQIGWQVAPWAIEQEEGFAIAFESDDESVATVDENGVVTAVATEDATCVVTATATYGEFTATAETNVIIKFIDKSLNGIVWDENGEVWFSGFNLKSLPAYDKLNESSMRLELTGATYDENGTLYAVTLDTDNWVSDLYTIDEETYEATKIGGSDEIGYMDICAAPSLGEDHLLAVYGPYVVIVNKTTGDYDGAFDLSSFTDGASLVGIAYEQQYKHPDYGNTDWVWLLDENGTLYMTGFVPYEGKYSRFDVSNVGRIAAGVDIDYWQSLYYDGVSLYWSRFNYDDNLVEIVMVEDIEHSGSVYHTGAFADSVWPVGGLYEAGVIPATGFSSSTEHAADEIDATAVFETEIASIAPAKAAGSLNAVEVTPTETAETGKALVNNAVTITADEAMTNGLYTVEYDTESVKLTDVSVVGINSVLEEEGKVTFAFVASSEIAEGDEIAELKFEPVVDIATSEVTITAAEVNDQHPGTVETAEIRNDVPVTAIELSETKLSFYVGNVKTVSVETITPENATDKTVTWSSSDESIATVDENGTITAVAIGTATITVKAVNGDATAEVTVEVIEVPAPVPSTPVTPVTPSEPEPEPEPEKDEWPFVDVTVDDWFYDVIRDAYYADLMDGVTADHFEPTSASSRGEIALTLWRLVGRPEPAAESKFEDVDASANYAKAIAWANEQGIILGTSETTAEPDRAVTRQELATIVYRYVQTKGEGFQGAWMFLLDYEDAAEVADWAYEAVCWCTANGIINGKDGNRVDPLGTSSRAEVAAIFARLYNSKN